MLAATLGRHGGHGAFKDLEQRLLHPLARHVAGDGGVITLPCDLVDLIDVNDASLGPLHIVVCVLKQAHDDVLYILAHVARLGEAGGVGDGEGDVQNPREGLGEEGLTRAGGPDEQDIALRQLDLVLGPGCVDSLVVVVDRDRDDLLRVLLAHHVLV